MAPVQLFVGYVRVVLVLAAGEIFRDNDLLDLHFPHTLSVFVNPIAKQTQESHPHYINRRHMAPKSPLSVPLSAATLKVPTTVHEPVPVPRRRKSVALRGGFGGVEDVGSSSKVSSPDASSSRSVAHSSTDSGHYQRVATWCKQQVSRRAFIESQSLCCTNSFQIKKSRLNIN
uniref:Uncharacterized protein n=1 Tax=Oryza meridionalis TaxID=40149 RepID=A0A0E0EW77_9ORYZ